MDYKKLLQQTEVIVLQAGAFLDYHFGKVATKDIEEKNENDFVSYVDKETEKILIKGFKEILPDAGFITEESTTQQRTNEKAYWIIDPLDGTTNFLFGVPIFCISVALVVNDELTIGIIYDVEKNELFSTAKGLPSTLNGQTIKVSERKQLQKSLLATGFPYDLKDKKDAYLGVFSELTTSTAGLRRLGSAAIDMAYVACGRCDAFYEWGLKPWDVAAGILLIQNAGGDVYDFQGGEDYLFGKEMVAGNPIIAKELQSICSSYFYK